MVFITNWNELLRGVIASYSQSNRDASIILNAVNEGEGEAFTSPLQIIQLTDAVFDLQRNAAFVAPGAMVARLYQALAGTVVGTNAIPDLAAGILATSNAVPAANLALTWRKTVFTFPVPFTLQPEHDYVIVIVLTNCPVGGQVEVGIDSAGTFSGNACSSLAPPAWVASAVQDCCFYLFSISAVLAGGLVDVSDRAARLLGITYGNLAQIQQLANLAADGLNPLNVLSAGVFPHVYDPVAADWNRWREGAAIGQALVDPADRWARQLGLIDLSRVLGALLTAANPVITGLYGVSGRRVPVLPEDLSIPVAPAKVVVAQFDTLVGAVLEGAGANLALNTNHRGAGTNSIEFDKAAGNVLAGVSYTIAALDLSNYSTHSQVDFFAYVPTPVGGTVVQVYAALGTDNGNLFYWAIPVADITLDAWNHIMLSMMTISGVLGVGADLSNVTYCAVYVQTSVAGATIANMLVSALVVKRAFESNIVNTILNPVRTEDSGINTNPRRLESDHGFVSAPIAVVGPAATLVWAVGTLCIRNPSDVLANGRTAGDITTVYTMELRNPDAAAQTAWLETAAAVVVSVVYELAANDSIVIDFPAGKTFGNIDLYINGSVVGIECQLEGIEL